MTHQAKPESKINKAIYIIGICVDKIILWIKYRCFYRRKTTTRVKI
jgi:hypothetical protein